MTFRPPTKRSRFADLKTTLAQYRDPDNALYQVVQQIIERLDQDQDATKSEITQVIVESGNIFAPRTLSYHTKLDEIVDLPNSVRLLAGAGITFDDSIANIRTIKASGILPTDAIGKVLISQGIGLGSIFSNQPVLLGPTAFLSIGDNPATTGVIRFKNGSQLFFRNAANNTDIVFAILHTDDNIYIGNAFGELFLNGKTIITMSVSASIQYSMGGSLKYILDALEFQPQNDNISSLGDGLRRWKDGFFGGFVQATGGLGATPLNASNITSGTLPLASLPNHALNHRAIGADPITVTLLAGYPGGTSQFLRSDGTFATPSGSGVALPTAALGQALISQGVGVQPILSPNVTLTGNIKAASGIFGGGVTPGTVGDIAFARGASNTAAFIVGNFGTSFMFFNGTDFTFTDSIKAANDYYEKGRSVQLGHWQDFPFNAANFSAASGTWTVTAGNYTCRYALVGKTMFLKINVNNTVTSAGTINLRTIIPGGFLAAVNTPYQTMWWFDVAGPPGNTWKVGLSLPVGNLIQFQADPAGTVMGASVNLWVSSVMTFEIQ